MTQTPRKHGFTCPKCGSEFFGTHKHYAVMGDQYPAGTSVGSCHGYLHGKSDCRHTWDRNDPVAEAEAIYFQSPEEWAESFKAFTAKLAPPQTATT